MFNVFFNCFLAVSTSGCEVNTCVPPTKIPIREMVKMLTVINGSARRESLSLLINLWISTYLPTAYLELVLQIYKNSTVVHFSISSKLNLSLYFNTEGLRTSWWTPAVRCGAVVRFHHLPVWGVWDHEEQLRGALQSTRLSHLHLPTRGLCLTQHTQQQIFTSRKPTHPHTSQYKESTRQRLHILSTEVDLCTESEFPVFGQTQSRQQTPQLVWLVAQNKLRHHEFQENTWPQVQFSSAGHTLTHAPLSHHGNHIG